MEDIPVLTSPHGRALLVELMQERLGPLPLRDQATSHTFFVEMAQWCSRSLDALAYLVSSVRYLAPGEPGCDEIQRIADQLEALTIVPQLEEIWPHLESALPALSLSYVGPLIHRVTDGRLSVLPAHCSDSWLAFVHLVGQNSGPGSLPPWMSLLELLRQDLDPTARTPVRSVLRNLATRYGLTGDLERLAADYDRAMPTVLRTGVVTVEVSPGAPGTDEFGVCTIQRWDDDRSAPLRSDEVLVQRRDLERAVEDALARVEQDWAGRTSELRIEFLLPLSLLNEPVEWWPKDSTTPPMVSLAVYHTVVLRSRDRLLKRDWHRRWLQRWERLKNEPAASRILWVKQQGEEHLRRLEAELMNDGAYVAVVLSCPPTLETESGQELVVALRAGIPLILWHRIDCDDPFRAVVAEELTADNLAHVLQRVTDLRRRIEILGPTAREAHPGRQLSLLWDDADWVPRSPSSSRDPRDTWRGGEYARAAGTEQR